MTLSGYMRKRISRNLSGTTEIRFRNKVPGKDRIAENIRSLDSIGLYLHIPFCDQICPYCPYNKEIIRDDAVRRYVRAVVREVKFYADLMDGKPFVSFYIGGGTPTTMLGKGIGEIIEAVYRHFNMPCSVHMESHPNHLSHDKLNLMQAMGVKYLSMGVEALQDRHLKLLERPYTVREVKASVEKAVSRNFECVNIDYIFDLPGHTSKEIEQAARDMVDLGIHQAATYPLFRFPYTRFYKAYPQNRNALATMFRRRKFLKILESVFYDAGYERSSVWAFTKRGTDKYCSVTVPSYIGLGASGSTYLKDLFYVNTFHVEDYNRAMEQGESPVALSVDLPEKAQMAGWLYWRFYETRFRKSAFQERFGSSLDTHYGRHLKLLGRMGFLQQRNDHIQLTDRGAYWIHAFEDFFSIDYINKLWGTSKSEAWPEEVVL